MNDEGSIPSFGSNLLRRTIMTTPTEKQLPDATKHQVISFIKSGIRIIGYALLIVAVPTIWMVLASIILIGSEVVGILEELV